MTPQSDEDEVWRQIVASFNDTPEPASGVQPWPDRENISEPPGDADRPARSAQPAPPTESTLPPGQPARSEHDNLNHHRGPAADQAGQGTPAGTRDDEDHYIPPPPPPLPRGDLISRVSWLTLFGGPAYLLLAALLGWSMDGWIVFIAVAAFIGGFVTLVVRMGDGPPSDSDWDDGAVI